MRTNRPIVRGLALAIVALVAAACSSKSTPSTSTHTIASTMIFGAPKDCPTNKYCEIGLKNVYGIVFKAVDISLDSGGSRTVAALKSGAVQVAELFSTSIYDPDFVSLKDDKMLESADYIAPVIRTAVATADVKSLLNGVSQKLNTDEMNGLNKQVDVGHKDPADVAKAFLQQNGLLATKTNTGHGKTIKVGVSGKFAESEIVAEMYAQVLENAGYKIQRQLALATRPLSDPALFGGQIDVKPEYLASEALHIDPQADVSGDPAHNAQVLSSLLAPKGVTLLPYSQAVDTNVFVVTKETAQKYNLVNVSDLAKLLSS